MYILYIKYKQFRMFRTQLHKITILRGIQGYFLADLDQS